MEPTIPEKTIYTFTLNDIHGEPVSLSEYKGKVLLLVNVASKCGFTKQYTGLENLYQTYKDQGFVVLGFPANNFFGQEPGTDEEIEQFCTRTFGVSFPMFSKISVKGKNIDPLYVFLTNKKTNPAFGGSISWNFNKFLIGRDGRILNRFGSRTAPDDVDVIKSIEAALHE